MKKVTRRFALWRADLDGGLCAVPEEAVAVLTGGDRVSVVVEHRRHGLELMRQTFATTLQQDVEWQVTGLLWPDDLRPGALVTVSWSGGAELTVRTAALAEPLRVDGVPYFHEYDPKVTSREYDPGVSNRGKVLLAVRKLGRVFEDGSAVLPEEGLAAKSGLGRGARGTFLLGHAVDQLLREGYLTRVTGSLDRAGYPSYPAVDGQKAAEMLFYAPLVEEGWYPGEGDDDEGAGGERRDHWVTGFVRKLPPGAHPSEKQLSLHERAVQSEEVEAGPLAPGYTFVKKHHRG